MAKRLDQIVVVDVESTCWENALGVRRGSPKMISEIIEIGACLLDPKTGERSQKTDILVKPMVSSVSEFCTKLTTLTQEQVDEGVALSEAYRKLRDDFNSPGRVWASFGDYDRGQFQVECARKGIRYPFGKTHVNVKNLIALTQGWKREDGMDLTLAALGMDLEGTHHRAHDDAWNVAKILAHALGRRTTK